MTRSFKIKHFICFFAVLSAYNITAQIPFDSNIISTNNLSTDFSKQNTSWNWLARYSAAKKIDANSFWSLKETFQSNLITPDNSKKQWKDEHRLKGLYYTNFKYATVGFYIDSWLLFDKQQKGRNEFSNHSAVLFTNFKPLNNISFTPYVGGQRAKNISIADYGWDVGIEGKAKDIKFGAYKNSIEASSNYDFFETRQNYTNNLSSIISTRFNQYTSDSLKVGYEESSKQFYNSTGTAITEVKLYNRKIQNSLNYATSNQNQLTFETNILSKFVSFNTNKNVSLSTNRNVFFIENRVIFRHFGPKLSYEVDFRTNDETFDNRETITDSRTRQSALGLKSIYLINADSRFNLDFTYIKLQYDTPDEDNNDDRDEQRFVINLGYQKKLSPVLNFYLSSYGFLYHQIYIFKEQSVNNNWNRVIKLEPKIKYRSKRVMNSLSSSVIANYTVYDFEEVGFRTRSFLSRKFTLDDSLQIPLYKNISIGLNARLELE